MPEKDEKFVWLPGDFEIADSLDDFDNEDDFLNPEWEAERKAAKKNKSDEE